MACVRPDGSITDSAKKMLETLQAPKTAEEASSMSGQPLFKVRSSLRELEAAGLVVKAGEMYKTTTAGLQKL